MAGLPDFDLWTRICLKYDIMILDQKLIRFRRIDEDIHASGDNAKNRIRNRFEHRQILNHYLKIEKTNELLLIFPDIIRYGKVQANLIPYFLGRMAIDTGWDIKMLWGLDVIYNVLKDENLSQILNEKYDFSYQDFIKLVSACDVFKVSNLAPPVNSPLPHRSVVRKFLSASKRYAKELYSIATEVFTK